MHQRVNSIPYAVIRGAYGICTDAGLSPVSIQTHATQALALRAMRALRKRKPQATQALDWLLRLLAASIDHSYWLALAFVA